MLLAQGLSCSYGESVLAVAGIRSSCGWSLQVVSGLFCRVSPYGRAWSSPQHGSLGFLTWLLSVPSWVFHDREDWWELHCFLWPSLRGSQSIIFTIFCFSLRQSEGLLMFKQRATRLCLLLGKWQGSRRICGIEKIIAAMFGKCNLLQ